MTPLPEMHGSIDLYTLAVFSVEQKHAQEEGWIMVDKNVSDAVQNAAASVQGGADAARDYASKGAAAAREYGNRGYNAARDYAGTARDYANKGYDAARGYASTGMDAAARIGDNMTDFVRNEPWIAVVAAFAVGYLAARMIRRLSI
jgi:ElaB/YqjD/DUF883 family membrane-anchored ribosome-binding protein